MSIWDGGYADAPEDEREGVKPWEDPLDGEMPGQPPHVVNEPEPWKPDTWHESPEYDFWKRRRNEESGG